MYRTPNGMAHMCTTCPMAWLICVPHAHWLICVPHAHWLICVPHAHWLICVPHAHWQGKDVYRVRRPIGCLQLQVIFPK